MMIMAQRRCDHGVLLTRIVEQDVVTGELHRRWSPAASVDLALLRRLDICQSGRSRGKRGLGRVRGWRGACMRRQICNGDGWAFYPLICCDRYIGHHEERCVLRIWRFVCTAVASAFGSLRKCVSSSACSWYEIDLMDLQLSAV